MLRFSESEAIAAKAELDRTLKTVHNNDSRLNIAKRHSVGVDSAKNSAELDQSSMLSKEAEGG